MGKHHKHINVFENGIPDSTWERIKTVDTGIDPATLASQLCEISCQHFISKGTRKGRGELWNKGKCAITGEAVYAKSTICHSKEREG